ncbi:MAG: tetratricopeptide repeat protein, partial [Planctomycetota bacterium]|nr:tetratricopeptide repeat protein [Planctomycetota bacterium]
VARLAAADVEELAEREVHPYSMDDQVLSGFAIYNFIYPAIRMGMVREYYWVVPDGTFPNAGEVLRFVRETIASKLQGVALEELETLTWTDSMVRGTLFGVPVRILELSSLPSIDEPVLLDLDMDYFTTVSARTAEVTERPRVAVESVLGALRERGLETDLVTICHSTVGGYFPVYERWLGGYVHRWLSDPSRGPAEEAIAAERRQAGLEMQSADFESAERRFARLVEVMPDEASFWLGLADARRRIGRPLDATRAFERALELDPLLIHTPLFDADRAWLSRRYADALRLYEAYLKTQADSPYRGYASRRRGDCLARLGRTREAIMQYREVVGSAPRHGDSRLELGILLRDSGDAEGALRQLHAARAILPERSVYALALGTTQLMRGDLPGGVTNLEAAIDLHPTLARARANLAAAYVELDRLQEAADHLGHALRVAPENPQYRRVANEIRGRGVSVPGPANAR